MQPSRPPKWHTRKQLAADRRNKPDETESDGPPVTGYWQKLKDNLSKGVLDGLSKFILFALTAFLAVILSFLGFNGARDLIFGRPDVLQEAYFNISGQLLTIDGEPLPGVSVVIVDHDVPSEKTTEGGYYDMRVKLPVETETVELRFVDENNNEVYREAVAVPKNSIANQQEEQHFVPNDPE